MTVDELRALIKKCPSRTVAQKDLVPKEDLVTIRRGGRRKSESLLDTHRLRGSRKLTEVRAGWYLPRYTVDLLARFRGAEVSFNGVPGGDPDSYRAPDPIDGQEMVITGAHYQYRLWLIPAEMFYPVEN